jgi:hypothetical protein
MPVKLRSGLSNEVLITISSFATVNKFLRDQDREANPTPVQKKLKTRRQMKSKIVRGAQGAKLRGAIMTTRYTSEGAVKVTTKLVREGYVINV